MAQWFRQFVINTHSSDNSSVPDSGYLLGPKFRLPPRSQAPLGTAFFVIHSGSQAELGNQESGNQFGVQGADLSAGRSVK